MTVETPAVRSFGTCVAKGLLPQNPCLGISTGISHRNHTATAAAPICVVVSVVGPGIGRRTREESALHIPVERIIELIDNSLSA